MTITSKSWKLGTVCTNCGRPIYSVRYEGQKYDNWTHSSGEAKCPSTWAQPPERFKDK